jgi:xanthine dehydrogenase accessory factor
VDSSKNIIILNAIENALAGGEAVVVATLINSGKLSRLATGAKILIPKFSEGEGSFGDLKIDELIINFAREIHEAQPRVNVVTAYLSLENHLHFRTGKQLNSDAEIMFQLWEQPLRLIVVGGGHVGLAVATLGDFLGFSVTVIDDRDDFANRERFPMADEVCCGNVGVEIDGLQVDNTSHFVLVSRGHLQDELALRTVLGKGAGYVGMIGSKRRTRTVIDHLVEEGYSSDELAAVSTPIGLSIGAETPEEIALSVLAEIIMLRRGARGERLSS